MLNPFQIVGGNAAFRDYTIRLNNVLQDRQYIDSDEIYYVLDNYILYLLFIEDPMNLERFCAAQIYNCEKISFIVMPESLWELRKNVELTLENLEKPIDSLQDFLHDELVKRFMKLMQARRGNGDWGEIVTTLRKLLTDGQRRSHIISILEFGRIRSFDKPIQRLRADIRSGKVLTLAELARKFAVREIEVPAEDRLEAYRHLHELRDRHRSDVVDALVYAKVKWLNRAPGGNRDGRACRFFSHESMINMLERSLGRGKQRDVRSLTDSFLLLKCLEEDNLTFSDVEDLHLQLRNVTERIVARRGKPGTLMVESYELRDRLSDLRQRALSSFHDYAQGYRSDDLDGLLQAAATHFLETLQHLAEEKRSIETIDQEIRDAIEDLYLMLNNFRNADANLSLSDFMKDFFEAEWELRQRVGEDKEDIMEVLIECLAHAETGEDLSTYLQDVVREELNRETVADRIRNKVLPRVQPEQLAPLGEFLLNLQRLE